MTNKAILMSIENELARLEKYVSQQRPKIFNTIFFKKCQSEYSSHTYPRYVEPPVPRLQCRISPSTVISTVLRLMVARRLKTASPRPKYTSAGVRFDRLS